MSQRPISLSPDLQKLEDDGYEIEIVAAHLVVNNVPYVDQNRQVKRGKLIAALDLAGEVTIPPKTHVALFSGDYPCDAMGNPIEKIRHGSDNSKIVDGLISNHSFSSKPVGSNGYDDYYLKMTTYIAIISGPARIIDPSATAQTRRKIRTSEPESVFQYTDTASSRAGITAVTEKLEGQKIAIIGLGGTGSFILDQVAKTPVQSIDLFDGDELLQHNAFRCPGVISLEELRDTPNKAEFWAKRYSVLHRNIVPHPYYVNSSNVHELEGKDMVFIAADKGKNKLPIIAKLEELNIPFIDVGMGVQLVDDSLLGVLRVTTSTQEMRSHIMDKKRINFAETSDDDVYSRNIQIADLNGMNAMLAVQRWKKHCGFYVDMEREHHSLYTVDGNSMINEDCP